MSILQYSLTSSSPFSWINLPKPLFGSDPQGINDKDSVFETDGGAVWVYRNFTRREWSFNFRGLESELAVWLALHNAVNGKVEPFYIRWNESVIMLCRKESGFRPRMIETPTDERVYEYTLEITEELTVEEF